MARPPAIREIPPPLELDCLRTLWRLGEANVAQVKADLEPRRNLAYTTVLTLLDRLARRGFVSRRKVGRSFLYAPEKDRESMRQIALRDLVDVYFDGSVPALADWLRTPAPPPPVGVNEAVEDTSRLDPALL